MNIIEKVLGLDSLCSYFGNSIDTGPEYDCIPLITLQGKNGSLVPGYTIRKYWDIRYNPTAYQDLSWNGQSDTPIEEPIPIMIPFPQKITPNLRSVTTLIRPLLVQRNTKANYLSTENIREVDKFDFSGLGGVVEYVKDNGILTMTLHDMENICVLLSEFNRGIVEKFKHCVTYYSCPGKLSTHKRYSLMLHLTFIDMGMCIPIFDSDKTDGIGVMCEYMHKSPDGLDYVPTGRGMAIVLSNDSENILTVDGTAIGISAPIHQDQIKSLIAMAVAWQQQSIKPDKQPIPLDDQPVSVGSYAVGTSTYGGTSTNYTSSGYYTISTS